jgi:hypothetical protein
LVLQPVPHCRHGVSRVGMFLGPLLGGSIPARFGYAAVFLTFGMLTLLNFVWVAAAIPANTAKS